jgi:hypothetical protein
VSILSPNIEEKEKEVSIKELNTLFCLFVAILGARGNFTNCSMEMGKT